MRSLPYLLGHLARPGSGQLFSSTERYLLGGFRVSAERKISSSSREVKGRRDVAQKIVTSGSNVLHDGA